MDILVLGGTRFVGRHIVAAALERGHAVTLFNRGTHPGLFPGVTELRGDRSEDVSALAGRTWDAVIDTSGYTPRQVRKSAEVLRASSRYLFISSISVYASQTIAFQDEDAPLATLEDETVEEVTGETYGGLKVLCERVVEEMFPDTHLILRPGLVVGPHDPTDRFTYWPLRVASGGEVLAPEGPELPVQMIDGRDLADFAVSLLEAGATGIYNVVSDPEQFTMGALLEAAQAESGADARVVWASAEALEREGVRPFADLPFWLPGEHANFARVANGRARAAGLAVRPLPETVRDTLAWATQERGADPLKAGMSREREAEVLARLE